MRPSIPSLPISPHLPEIADKLKAHSRLIVQATPGSGKTTRIPPFLLESTAKAIWVLEPRRLAAKLSAMRVAEERGEKVGETVGYHFRFEKAYGPRTRLLFLTEGMLIRRMLSDPELREVGILILDEFHERSLPTDLALALTRRLQKGKRPDLQLLVMSATLDTERLAQYLDGAPVLSFEGRQFPVEVENFERPEERALEINVQQGVRRALTRCPEGDILVFLPGMREIRRAQEGLERLKLPVQVFPLHGELSPAEQQAALAPARQRKVILSTNIAETSLTIAGVRCVIDSGLQRSATHSYWSGMTRLTTKPIAKAAAIQRAGRAGRLGPGVCIRLYTREDFETRAAFDMPEIQRTDLSQTLLELRELGVTQPSQFSWFEPPSVSALEAAEKLLRRLGAINEEGRITPVGERLAAMPVHPRLGKLLVEAERLGVAADAVRLAALIQSENYTTLDLAESLARHRGDRQTDRIESQLKGQVRLEPRRTGDGSALGQALLTGFPDRVARVRKGAGGGGECLLSEGGTARVVDAHLEEGDYLVLIDVGEMKNERSQVSRQVRAYLKIAPEWLLDLPHNPVREAEEAKWDERQKIMKRFATLAYGQLILESTEIAGHAAPSGEGLRPFVEEALGLTMERWQAFTREECLALAAKYSPREAVETTLARALLLTNWEVLRPPVQAAILDRPFRELEKTDWSELILSALPPEVRSGIDRLVPTHLLLKAGRRAPIGYALDRAPWLESRLQDFFGMQEVPRILNGKMALTLHLLAPNHRAVQVTQDLKGFWEREYPRVRKELARQYPRHAWPENPLVVPPPKPKR